MQTETHGAIGVMTSGGDAPGMNAALRAVVRAALNRSVTVYAIINGYQGLVEGSGQIRPLSWGDVGGIMQRGGTIIGTARCPAFRTREGRLQAAQNLVQRDINQLVVIGGDGSLTGADTFRREWPALMGELVASGRIPQELADRYPSLGIVGLVGSIDNDFVGTDMTIGADTALHRITGAIDALTSTAASHQRAFVVEVMGRHCGYLALTGSIAGGADYVLIPEHPPEDGWEDEMCDLLRAGRAAGRRDSIVVVAEGARDRHGHPISSEQVRQVLEERLGEDTRVTILGHVQRGGSPSAFDRWMSTLIGYAAVDSLLSVDPSSEPQVIGMRYNRITHAPLVSSVEQTRSVAEVTAQGEYDQAMRLRGGSFAEMFDTFRQLARALPRERQPVRRCRIALVHAGGPAPGMNTAARAAVRLALDQGHNLLGVRNGISGLIAGQVEPINWGSVDGWGGLGGAELGTSRTLPDSSNIQAIARTLEEHQVDALLMIGGLAGYEAMYRLHQERAAIPAFNIPILCIPVSINNNLPGCELSVGADTALNSIVDAVDRIKQSAVAAQRCFVVEVMGQYCGYLALLSGIATGAEQVYLHESGVRLRDLQADLERMVDGFQHGKRLSLAIRNERANDFYTTGFMAALFAEEARDLFDVRQAILGHIQQGGSPTPFDRILATRFAAHAVAFLGRELANRSSGSAFVGLRAGRVHITNLEEMPDLIDTTYRRPKAQWWIDLLPTARSLARREV